VPWAVRPQRLEALLNVSDTDRGTARNYEGQALAVSGCQAGGVVDASGELPLRERAVPKRVPVRKWYG
jgi:hypothetical protein